MSSAFLNLTSLLYLDITPALPPDFPASSSAATLTLASTAAPSVSEEVIQARILAARLAEREQTEQRLAEHYEQRHTEQVTELEQRSARNITNVLAAFSEERSSYFAHVETEVVHLALAIARKILEREAKTDPLLLAGLVRIALDEIENSSAVRLRVSPDRIPTWQAHLTAAPTCQRLELLPDASLSPDDCILETEAGVARLNYDIQLKEIERGFLDLLGHRPDRAGHPSAAAPAPGSIG